MGPVNGLDAQGGFYKRFGCTGWAPLTGWMHRVTLFTVWMHRMFSIHGLDAEGGSYKRFGCTGWAL